MYYKYFETKKNIVEEISVTDLNNNNQFKELEEKISESECIEETVDFVIKKLKPKYEFEKVNIHDVVSEDWNEYWQKYYVRGC